ncbi:MAG TPA: BON domain-containing protein [Kiritimatiellia bacterium]|nr:BON domain-containing protein [Kiritimatiellia bacterium]HMP34080.1 BON domain-containing protein [Kiritimatiellia bacterium]
MSRLLVAWVMMAWAMIGAGCASLPALDNGGDPSDTAVRVRIEQRLSSDPVTAPLRLGITVDDGIVTLSGRIDQAHVRLRAVSIVRGTPGVRGVIDKTLQF